MLKGTGLTLKLTGAAFVLGLGIGLFTAIGRRSRLKVINFPLGAYVELIRGTPAVVQLFIIYYGLAEYGVQVPRFWAATIALALFSGAFFAEIFRGGIESVDQGQFEAARALGMKSKSVMWKVILPQTVLIVIPPVVNMSIDLLKATALVVTIGAPDLMYYAFSGASDTYRAMDFYLIAGIIYLAIAFPISYTIGRLEEFAKQYSAKD